MSASWKEAVIERWQEIDLPEFCATIGIDYDAAFLAPLSALTAAENPYADYRWEIMQNARIKPGVLHLIPFQVTAEATVWEEWFFVDGEFHHHVLRNHEHLEGTDTWQGNDSEHPIEVHDVLWHHHNDGDLRPSRYR